MKTVSNIVFNCESNQEYSRLREYLAQKNITDFDIYIYDDECAVEVYHSFTCMELNEIFKFINNEQNTF